MVTPQNKLCQYRGNILDQEFTADPSNQKWVTDIKHLEYSLVNKAYLSVIKDLYDGPTVAYQAGYYNNNELVMETSKQPWKQTQMPPFVA